MSGISEWTVRAALALIAGAVMSSCGGAGRYAGVWSGACDLGTETWELELELESNGKEPTGIMFVALDSFGYERYYSGDLTGVAEDGELSLSSDVVSYEDEDDVREFDMTVAVDGDEMSGSCTGGELTGTALLERK